MRRTLAVVCAVLAMLALPPAAFAQTPAGFFGISPQGTTNPADFELMAEAGVRSVRLPLFWSHIEPVSPLLRQPDWSSFDRDVELAARYGMEILPVVGASPSWIAAEFRLEPARAWQLRAWASFLRRALKRYGYGGTFWRSDPDLPYMPIRRWEIWNEENIVTFGRADPQRFAALARVSGRIVHGGGGEAILGGLFGRPLQIPPNVSSGGFLSELYRARRVKRFFDGVALHPYVADAAAMRAQIRNLRRVMRVHSDAATPLYVTELGWGSASFETRWERGPWGQARELGEAFSMLAGHRRAWRIGGVWWFSWTDANGSCQFCDSAGLLNENREAKPAWYEFNAWTGGDADIVPRASLGVEQTSDAPVLTGE
jgi:polysaccharide biosynthesis protein PslG